MKKYKYILTVFLMLVSCQKHSNQTWENMKTAGSYLKRGVKSFYGKNSESVLITNEGDFYGPFEGEYIPLNEKDLKNLYSDGAYKQSNIIPGKGKIPKLSNFTAPKGNLKNIFANIRFETDDHVLRNREDLVKLQSVAKFLKKNPNTYISIEGHCDERASAAYNMALGTRRSNHIRVLLIKHGVDYSRLYTISYGKEKPLTLGHTSRDWQRNRRVEFKIYKR